MRLFHVFAFIFLFTVVSVHQITAKGSEVDEEDDTINKISESKCALDADDFYPCDMDTFKVTLNVKYETSVDCNSTISKEEASSEPSVTYLEADKVTLILFW